MTISNKVLDKIFDRFKSKDSHRPAMQHPSIVGRSIVATDAHILIHLPTHMVEDIEQYEAVEGYPNIEGLLKTYRDYKKRTRYNVASVMDILNKIPKEPVYEDCSYCDGEGTIECSHCYHENECDECVGTGRSNKQIGEQLRKYRELILIDQRWFSPQLIYNIFLSYQEMGIEEVFIEAETGYSLMFNGSNVLTVIMAVTEKSYEQEIITIDPVDLKAGIPAI